MPLLARPTDPTTSHDAAVKAESNAALVRNRVLEIMADYPDGITDDELTDAYELTTSLRDWEPVHVDTPRKRRSDLVRLGLVRATLARRSGKTVWTIA